MTARTSVIRLNVTVFRSMRSMWNGMNVKPIANVFTSISRSAAVEARLPTSASASHGAASSSSVTTMPLSASRKKKIVLAIRCRLAAREDGWHVEPTKAQGSHVLTSMLGAGALALLPAGDGTLEAGARVDAELLTPGTLSA